MISKNLVFRHSYNYSKVLNTLLTYTSLDLFTEITKCKDLVMGDLIIYMSSLGRKEDLCLVLSVESEYSDLVVVKLSNGVRIHLKGEFEILVLRKLPSRKP